METAEISCGYRAALPLLCVSHDPLALIEVLSQLRPWLIFKAVVRHINALLVSIGAAVKHLQRTRPHCDPVISKICKNTTVQCNVPVIRYVISRQPSLVRVYFTESFP